MRCLRVPAAFAVTIVAVALPVASVLSWGCHHEGTGPENDALMRGFDARGHDGGADGHPGDAGGHTGNDGGTTGGDSGVPMDAAPDAGAGTAVGP